jgi:hypothetical protein
MWPLFGKRKEISFLFLSPPTSVSSISGMLRRLSGGVRDEERFHWLFMTHLNMFLFINEHVF